MTDLRTAAQQALEALMKSHTCPLLPDDCENAITALRAALAQEQAEQTWVCPEAPEERAYSKPGHCENCGKPLVLAQEQAEPVQEPVGWLESPHGAFRADPLYKMQFPSQLLHWQIALYTAPPQRLPLTEEEIYEMYNEPSSDAEMVAFARAVERAHGIPMPEPVCPDCRGIGYDASGQLCACQENPSF